MIPICVFKSKTLESRLEALCDPVSPVTNGLHVRHLGGEQASFLGGFPVSVSRNLFSETVGLFFKTVQFLYKAVFQCIYLLAF